MSKQVCRKQYAVTPVYFYVYFMFPFICVSFFLKEDWKLLKLRHRYQTLTTAHSNAYEGQQGAKPGIDRSTKLLNIGN